MIPGLTTKLSESYIALSTSINPKTDLVIINDTTVGTTFATIVPNFGGGFSGVYFVANRSGATIAALTTGNILGAATIDIAANKVVVFCYSKSIGKYIVGATT